MKVNEEDFRGEMIGKKIEWIQLGSDGSTELPDVLYVGFDNGEYLRIISVIKKSRTYPDGMSELLIEICDRNDHSISQKVIKEL